MDGYSRIVALLRVILPLAALALLSTLFLLPRNRDPVAAVPFAQGEISKRVKGEQVTGPFFSGTTTGGDRVSVTAVSMRTGRNMVNEVDDLTLQIDLVSGTRINLMSDQGQFDMTHAMSELTGNVIITTSNGIEMKTDSLIADLDNLTVEAPFTTATGPLGRLESGQMRMEQRGPAHDTHFVFTESVKLIYDPKSRKE